MTVPDLPSTSPVVLDTSALVAFFNSADIAHERVSSYLADARSPLVVSPYVVAELDHLVSTRLGVRSELAVLESLTSGAWDLEAVSEADLRAAADVIARFADQNVGITDASLVVLAARYRTTTIATLDHRHFTVLRSLDGRPFTIVP